MTPTPRELNLPHESWRPGQYEAIQAIKQSPKRIVLLDAVTGSGKTSLGLGLGVSGETVRALTFTRSLQIQYGHYPGVEVLFGLNAYPCSLLNNAFQADSCAFPSNMMKCQHANDHLCAYVNQREMTKVSARQALSYQYYFNATWPKRDDAAVDYLYCDEAHHLPQGVMSQMTFEITPSILSRLNLSALPRVPNVQTLRVKFIAQWLERLLAEIGTKLGRLQEDEGLTPKQLSYKKALTAIGSSAQITYAALDNHQDSFYIYEDETQLRVVPLTPAPFFNYVFGVPDETKIVLASATMGNHREFAGLLGLGRNWESHIVPPVFPVESQPVFYYGDGVRMGHKAGIIEQKRQIALIRQIVDQFPAQTHALIHFVSIKAAKEYGRILTHYYGDRIWMPDETHTTEEKVAAWTQQKREQPGTICLAWSFHTGIDAPDVDINIVQKVPFLALDEINQQLLEKNPKLYQWVAGVGVEQACGRIRRGHPDHYEVDGQPTRKIVVILDNNFHMVKNYFSDHFREALVRL